MNENSASQKIAVELYGKMCNGPEKCDLKIKLLLFLKQRYKWVFGQLQTSLVSSEQ